MSADNFANLLKEAQALGTVHLTKLLASNGVLSKSALKLLTDQQISLLGTKQTAVLQTFSSSASGVTASSHRRLAQAAHLARWPQRPLSTRR